MSGRRSAEAVARLEVALRDPQVVGRYWAKVVLVPGSSCWWWTGSVSGRGHGRFWVERDLVVIAHRFGFGLQHGVAALEAARVLGHRCDNPLCQRVGPGHVVASSARLNRREWAARRLVGAGPLADPRGSRGRARVLRDLARRDPALVAADQDRLRLQRGFQPELW